MSAHSMEVSASDFNALVIEGSKQAPVIVDFWASWCAPCRALAPVLEKLAAEYGGRFTLAKVNSDENQALAARYGVRGIPNVKAFVGGELIDEFSGALPEPLVREFLERVIPSPAEELRRQAVDLYRATRDARRALALLAQAAGADPRNELVRLDSAEILIDLGMLDEARKLLETLSGLARMEERATALRARLDFAAAAALAGDAAALEARIARDANDLDARLALANLYVTRQEYRTALDQLLEIVRRDRSFKDDIARKTMLQVFSLLGAEHGLVSEYRKLLASAMY